MTGRLPGRDSLSPVRVLTLSGLALLPWTAFLRNRLPRRHVAVNWNLAWVGFDLGLAATLLATAAARASRSPAAQPWAATAAALLCCDAWFDVVTAARGRQRTLALALALCFELPLAGLCAGLAIDGGRRGARSSAGLARGRAPG